MYGNTAAMIARFGDTEIIRLSQIEDRETEEVNSARVEFALNDASAMIDSYLRGRYLVPVQQPPADLVRAACIIARYDLAKSGRSGPTETMAEEFKGVIKWLQDVQKGIAQLDAPKAGLAGESSGSRFSDREPIFTPDNLRWS